MKVKNTVGTLRGSDNNKDYLIFTECGQTFRAVRSGTMFSLQHTNVASRKMTLKQCKRSIEAGEVYAIDPSESENHTPERTTPVKGERVVQDNHHEVHNTEWDCIHPCALLARLTVLDLGYNTRQHVMHTLDSYGWLDEKGNPDRAAAEREVKRYAAANSSASHPTSHPASHPAAFPTNQ